MSDRAFHWTVGSVTGAVVVLFVALMVAMVLSEPKRRAIYMADCEGRGFTAPQCVLLYRQKQDADAATFLALSAVATSAATAARR